MSNPKVLDSTLRVRFPDCDPFGHLNNARYIDYFMNTRQDHIEQFYDFQLFRDDGTEKISWVSIKNQIAYLAPAMLNETVVIETKLIHATKRTLLVEGIMYDESRSHIKAVIWMEFMVINVDTMRPAIHDETLMPFFEGIVWGEGDIDTNDFNGRVRAIRTDFKAQRHAA